MMDIEVEITRKDFQAFNKYVMKSRKIFRAQGLIILAFLIVLMLLLNIKRITDVPYMIANLVVIIIIYFVLVLILKPITSLMAKYIPKKSGRILGKRTFRISDEGLWELTEHNESLNRWKGVQTIEANDKYIFVFTDTHMGHIIPKRCFSSEQECKKFHNALIRKLAEEDFEKTQEYMIYE